MRGPLAISRPAACFCRQNTEPVVRKCRRFCFLPVESRPFIFLKKQLSSFNCFVQMT